MRIKELRPKEGFRAFGMNFFIEDLIIVNSAIMGVSNYYFDDDTETVEVAHVNITKDNVKDMNILAEKCEVIKDYKIEGNY